jgi:hypothetical protein
VKITVTRSEYCGKISVSYMIEFQKSRDLLDLCKFYIIFKNSGDMTGICPVISDRVPRNSGIRSRFTNLHKPRRFMMLWEYWGIK